MTSTIATAREFFDACEFGRGWEVCRNYCHDDATFICQSDVLTDVKTLSEYTDWMKGLLTPIPDSNYEVRAFALDPATNSVSDFGVFSGTHTGEGGPVPPTGKSVKSDYVYVMEFDGRRIKRMTKIWNSKWALEQLGWA